MVDERMRNDDQPESFLLFSFRNTIKYAWKWIMAHNYFAAPRSAGGGKRFVQSQFIPPPAMPCHAT
jgi:hypothetical protein